MTPEQALVVRSMRTHITRVIAPLHSELEEMHSHYDELLSGEPSRWWRLKPRRRLITIARTLSRPAIDARALCKDLRAGAVNLSRQEDKLLGQVADELTSALILMSAPEKSEPMIDEEAGFLEFAEGIRHLRKAWDILAILTLRPDTYSGQTQSITLREINQLVGKLARLSDHKLEEELKNYTRSDQRRIAKAMLAVGIDSPVAERVLHATQRRTESLEAMIEAEDAMQENPGTVWPSWSKY